MSAQLQRQVCTFFVDNLFLGIQATTVQEVLRYQKLTRVPLAPPAVSGLMNLRGQIVTTLDLRRLLDLPLRPKDATPMNVVVRVRDSALSLQVDEVGDVVEVQEETFEVPPQTLRGPSKILVRGVYKTNGRLLLMLDTEVLTQSHVLNVVDVHAVEAWKPNEVARRTQNAES